LQRQTAAVDARIVDEEIERISAQAPREAEVQQ